MTPNPRRLIFVSMLIAAGATSLNMATQQGRYARPDYWRVWFGATAATFLALVLDAFGAGEVAAPITMTAAAASLLGGKAAADAVVQILGGKTATGARTTSTPGASPSTSTGGAQVIPFPNIPPGGFTQPVGSGSEGSLV